MGRQGRPGDLPDRACRAGLFGVRPAGGAAGGTADWLEEMGCKGPSADYAAPVKTLTQLAATAIFRDRNSARAWWDRQHAVGFIALPKLAAPSR